MRPGCDVLPKISIITPNRNGGPTLRRTIESVLQQDYPRLEYIIVDGNSTDDSPRIMAEYQSRIHCVVRGRDHTMYDGIAKGFDLASGDILAWLNSDDMYEPGVLLRVGRYFARHPRWSVLYFNGTVWKEGWRVQNQTQKPVGLPELLHGHVLYQDNVFFRRSAYEAVGGLERRKLKVAGDYDLWLKLAARYRLHFIPEHGSCFRKRPDQLSGDWGAYLGEMAAVRSAALQQLPPLFRWRSAPGRFIRKLAAQVSSRSQRFAFALHGEKEHWSNENWPAVQEAPEQPLTHCHCPVCGRYPDRLLFSTPDTRFGDRTVRQVYYCSRCETAFLFPRPDEAELAALYERTYSAEQAALGEPPPDTFSPYRVPSLLQGNWYLRPLGYLYKALARASRRLPVPCPSYDDIVFVDEPKASAILEIGCFEGRVLDGLRQLGYGNLFGTDFNTKACAVAAAKGYAIYAGDITRTDWPGRPMDAIVLNQLIEHIGDPVGLLRGLKQRLVPGGRVYLSTPNLDSRWLQHYGPSWSHWHFPFHQFITGQHGIRKIARRAGYEVKWIKTNSPVHWSYMSDQLGVRGLGGYVSHNIHEPDRDLWHRAHGVTFSSWLLHDWRQRGDCLHACLVLPDESAEPSLPIF